MVAASTILALPRCNHPRHGDMHMPVRLLALGSCLAMILQYSCATQGYGVVRELENVATEEGDKPTHECYIKDCGELPSGADFYPPTQVLQNVIVSTNSGMCLC